MSPTSEQIAAGQAVYTRKSLDVYDLAVLGVSNRFIWKCPTPVQLEHYNSHVSGNHLDVGVGTGYFLDRCRFPVSTPQIVLMDMNRHALEFSAARIARYGPKIHQQDVFQPVRAPGGTFDSIGINYLLHCLPGSLNGSKTTALDHLIAALSPNGTLFGATILHQGVPRSWAATKLMNFYNRRGIFSNMQDSVAALDKILRARLDGVRVDVRGCVALFSGRKP